MIRVGWAKEDPLFRRVFTRIFIPDASEEQMRWFDELQRMSTSPENAVASRLGRQAVDMADELPRSAVPTLILQALGDQATTFDNAVEVAGRIPDARLVELDSANHILLDGEPAWPTFVEEVRAFLEPDRRADAGIAPTPVEPLSPRELDVLRLAARGPGQRRDRRGARVEPANRRTPSVERVRKAGGHGQGGASGGRRGGHAARTRLTGALRQARARLGRSGRFGERASCRTDRAATTAGSPTDTRGPLGSVPARFPHRPPA